eukprot:SAG11_NODE_1929_length_4049_cov_7.874430_3_plen_115_part_00
MRLHELPRVVLAGYQNPGYKVTKLFNNYSCCILEFFQCLLHWTPAALVCYSQHRGDTGVWLHSGVAPQGCGSTAVWLHRGVAPQGCGSTAVWLHRGVAPVELWLIRQAQHLCTV